MNKILRKRSENLPLALFTAKEYSCNKGSTIAKIPKDAAILFKVPQVSTPLSNFLPFCGYFNLWIFFWKCPKNFVVSGMFV